MARRTIDFSSAFRNQHLCRAIPAMAELTPQMLTELWRRMPTGNLPKTHIFAGAVALAVEAATAAKDHP